MSGSLSNRPRPSYEDGKTRDPEIERLQNEAARSGDKQRSGLLSLLKRAVQKSASK